MSNTQFNDRKFLILNVNEISKIDFNLVLETSSTTLRKSVDGTKTFIKWVGDTPEFVNNITSKQGPYTYTQILPILLGTEWVVNNSVN